MLLNKPQRHCTNEFYEEHKEGIYLCELSVSLVNILEYPVDEGARVDFHRNVHQFQDAVCNVFRKAAESLFAFLLGGTQRVADHAALDELVVVHREGEVFKAI